MYEQIMAAWVMAITQIIGDDWTVIRAEAMVGEGAIRPNGPFVTVKLIAGPNDYTIDEVQVFDENNQMELRGAKWFTVSIQAFRETAMNAVMDIKTQLKNPDIIDFLRNNAGISVTNRGGVTDLSQQFETGFEERFQVDISFAAGFTANTTVGIIESANVESELRVQNG